MVARRKSKASKDGGNIVYAMIGENELQERERKYTRCIDDVQICNGLVNDGRARYNYLMAKKNILLRWDKYVQCPNMPNPIYPQDIRFFIEKLRHQEHENVDKTVDWTLAVVEKSILTQDIFRTDLTRKTLRKELCPNLGEFYNKYVNKCLLVIHDIEKLMGNDFEFSLIDLPRSKDIVDLKTELELEIESAIDKLTYQIVAAKDTYMHTDDGIEATYSCKGDNFTIDIWGLRDVPIRFDQLDWPMMMAKMPNVGVNVQIPLSCLSQALTLRCTLTSFDHCSHNAKTFEQIVTQPTDDLIAGIPDIVEALISEWVMQTNIMEEVRNKMKAARAWYEQTKIQLAQKVAEMKKDEKGKKVKLPKVPKETPVIEDGMYPDTYNLFLERENQQFKNFLNDFYHPGTLKLLPGQINLKKYIISGGIYSLAFVSPPKHTDFNNLNITSHHNYRKLVILKDIIADLDFFESSEESSKSFRDNFLNKKGSRVSSIRGKSVLANRIDMTRSRMEANIGDNKIQYQINPEDVPYFFVTLQLPREHCRWEWPIVCHYEESDNEVEELPELKLELVPRPPRPTSVKPTGERSNLIEVSFVDTPMYENYKVDVKPKLTLRQYSESAKMVGTTNSLATRLPSLLRKTILPEEHESFSAKIKAWNSSIFDQYDPTNQLRKSIFAEEDESFPAKFNAIDPKNQIRILERYCLPDIISSFKFPNEIREMKHEFSNKKSKFTFRENLMASETLVETISDNPKLNFEDQHNPERVFPIFEDGVGNNIYKFDFFVKEQPEEVSYLIDGFDDIRQKYIENPNKILVQKEFSTGAVQDKKKSLHHVDSKLNFPKPMLSASVKKMRKASRATIRSLESSGKLMDHAQAAITDELLNFDVDNITVRSNRSSTRFQDVVRPKKTKKVFHWTVSHISDTHIDETNMTVTVKTDRLGTFGLAFNRYTHFPYRNWSLKPSELNPEEIVFTLDTFHARVILNISSQGFTGYVTDLQKHFVSKPIKYLSIDEPIMEFKELKKRFLEMNINIFAEPDATYYIKNGYFSEKHLATEIHVYEAMAVNCMLLKFFYSQWNRLATRRNLILCFQTIKDKDDNSANTVRVTPEEAKFVEIKELCSDHLDNFNLEYTPTWRNINYYADLHHLINSLSSNFSEARNDNPMTLVYILTLLSAVRPLSYS